MTVAARIAAVRSRIAAASGRVGRDPADVLLVAVSKGHDAAAIAAAVDAGCREIGESYVQEWLGKRDQVERDVCWHFIGHLQSNKVRDVVGRAVLIHSVDRPSLIDAIARRARALDTVQDVLLEVNIGGESTKSGCMPSEVEALAAAIASNTSTRLRGLMTVAPPYDDPEAARPVLRSMRVLRDRLRELHGPHVRELSMGMTDDLEIAVEEGATIVRVGTAIFGPRKYT